MNPVVTLTHNLLDLTKRCVESVINQDCGDIILDILDNDSSDGTYEWAKGTAKVLTQYRPQLGVSAGWNTELRYWFEAERANHVLVIGNDTVLPPWFYSSLLSYDVPFVTGIAVSSMDEIASQPEKAELVTHPDFSAYLIRRECWEKVGAFDEAMVSWASDCDYHVRAHRLGVPLYKANVPFFHIRSRTIELAPPRERRELDLQADADRLAFAEKWSVRLDSPKYAELFSPETFDVDK